MSIWVAFTDRFVRESLIDLWPKRPKWIVLALVCQHATAWSRFNLGHMYGCLERYSDATLGDAADRDMALNSPDQAQHDPGHWEQYVPPDHMEKDTVFIWCDRLQSMSKLLLVRLLISQVRCRTFEIAPCDTPIIPDISTSEEAYDPRTEHHFQGLQAGYIRWHDYQFGLRW